MQRLREDDAIESARREGIRLAEIGKDGRQWIGRVNVEHVAAGDAAAAKPLRILGVEYLQTRAAYVRGVLREELFDVHTIDGCSAIVSPGATERRRAPQAPPAHSAWRVVRFTGSEELPDRHGNSVRVLSEPVLNR